MHLIATTGKRRQILNERISANHALDAERLTVAVQTERHNLINAILNPGGGGLRTVSNSARWIKGDFIAGLQRPFSQGVMRLFPQVVFGAVAVPATFRTGIRREFIDSNFRGFSGSNTLPHQE